MEIPDRILQGIKDYFPDRNPSEVYEILALFGEEDYEYEVERVQLAILKLSNGNFEDLFKYTEVAKQDYRDVLFWSEGGE